MISVHLRLYSARANLVAVIILIFIQLCCLLTVSESGETGLSVRAAETARVTFEQRLEAQAAIERFYYDRRLWPEVNPGPKPLFENVISFETLHDKVSRYLKQTLLLEKYWNTVISGEHLQAEITRIERNTREAGTLNELYQVLGNDPVMIAECLARPVLVDRLSRSWYSHDERLHGSMKEQVLALSDQTRPESSVFPDLGDWITLSLAKGMDLPEQGPSSTIYLADEEFDDRIATFPQDPDILGFEETPGAFLLKRTDFSTPTEFKGSLRIFAKQSYDDWLEKEVVEDFGSVMAQPPATGYTLGRALEGGSIPDSWATEPYVPSRRAWHLSVWTGSEMIVWGGSGGNTGGKYDPLTDTWTRTSELNAPSFAGTAVWTGSEMIVWGGYTGALNSGGRYNPQTDTWTPTSTETYCPSARSSHTAVWNGYYMIVWGGMDADYLFLNNGARYIAGSNSWATLSTTGAPEARIRHIGVFVGWEMIVWGGQDSSFSAINSGGRYNPAANTWAATCSDAAAPCNAPTARVYHSAISTGNRMIIWGGGDNSGARYDPDTNTWAATSTGTNCPAGRLDHTATWTGQWMIIWGGNDGFGIEYNNGARYRPDNNTWNTMSPTNAPQARSNHTAIWTGAEMIVWGGSSLDTGGRYSPSSNSWTPTSYHSGPSQRSGHTAVWTGAEMIVWGGNTEETVGSGGHYYPLTDSWTPTGAGNFCPSGRFYHTAVWTGTDMIVWGGYDVSQFNTECNTGGRYEPIARSWQEISTGTNCPTIRQGHSAVWTGTNMTIWGGSFYDSGGDVYVYLNNGGRYTPGTNTWLTVSTGAGCPTGRYRHSAVWSGKRMIIWGGYSGTTTPAYKNDGSRYDPTANTWGSVSMTNAPEGRHYHTAVWNEHDDEMIVWGGMTQGSFGVNTGARYNPTLDLWSTMPISAAAEPRFQHSAIWTGSEMIVWGGHSLDFNWGTSSGGRYLPAEGDGLWTDMPLTGAPPERYGHTSIWSGSEMIMWGGYRFSNLGIFYPSTTPRSLPDADLSAVLLLHLDEAPGTTSLLDASGFGNNGECTGSQCPATGVAGQARLAASFDGTNDLVRVPASSSLNTATAITMMAWIKPEGSVTQPIIEYGDETDLGVLMWQYNSFDRLHANFRDTGGNAHTLMSPTGQFSAGKWYHVAATYDGNIGRIYVNGSQVASAALGSFTLFTDISMYVGRRAQTSNPKTFNGAIDEVAIFNRAMSPQEVRDRFIRDSAVLYLHLDDPEPTDIFQDSSAWGNHPVCLADQCPSALTAGRVNGARSFDGDDDYLVTPHRPELDFDATESFSIQAWIRTEVGSQGLNAKIVSKRPVAGYTQNNYSLQLRYNAYGGMEVYADGTGWVQVYGGPDLRDGQWHHVVGVVDRDAGLALAYVDGDLVDSKTFTGSVSNIADVMVGRIWDGGTDESFSGDIDEVIIFNRALSLEEIQNLYNSPPENVTFILGQSDMLNLDGGSSTVGSNFMTTVPDYDRFDTLTFAWDLHDVTNCQGLFDVSGIGLSLDEATLQSYGFTAPGMYRIWLKTIDATDRAACAPLVISVQDGSVPTATIVSPNGGESWAFSLAEDDRTSHLIVWDSDDNFTLARTRLSYSTDHGLTWSCLADSDNPGECPAQNLAGTDTLGPDDHAFLWVMPTAAEAAGHNQVFPSAECRIKVEVFDSSDNTAEDISDNNFYIIQPTTTAIKTIILWDSGRIETLYGPESTNSLNLKLQELADHDKISGVVLDLSLAPAVQQAYSCWDSCYPGPCNTSSPCDESGPQQRANSVATAVHEYLYDELSGQINSIYTNARYIILIGDDMQIPFYRMLDGTSIYPEPNYPAEVGLTITNTVGSALAQGYFLTDNYYSEVSAEESNLVGDGSVYHNDLAIGRLVETPEQITTTVNTFIARDGQVNLTEVSDKVLVTGFDFFYDSACDMFQVFAAQKTTLGLLDDPDNIVGSPCGDVTYSSQELKNQVFASPPPRLSVINTHAHHYGWAASDLSVLTTTDMVSESNDLSGTIVYSSGCHAGLAVPSEDTHPLDLVETMVSKEAMAYIGNTGYGWGIKYGKGLTEKLMELITDQVLAVDSLSIGNALANAKRQYYLEAKRYDVFDEKVMHQLTLYGIPNTLILTDLMKNTTDKQTLPPPAGPDHACVNSVCLSKTMHSALDNKALPPGVTELVLNFSFGAGTYNRVTTDAGDYFTLNGRSSAEVGDTIQPHFVYDSQLSGTNAHGVIFSGGHYTAESPFTPVIGVPQSNTITYNNGPLPLVSTFTPCVRISYGNSGGSTTKGVGEIGYTSMVVHTGYFEEAGAEESRFDDLQMVIYYSNSLDLTPPEITDPGAGGFHTLEGTTASFSVDVSDTSGVYRVLLTYNDRRTSGWKTLDLAQNGSTWEGSLVLKGTILYFVQAIDNAGNVGMLSSSGPDLTGDDPPVPYGSTWDGPLTFEIALTDSDNDGLPDFYEDHYWCLDSANGEDAVYDPDYDYLINLEEFDLDSDPCLGDTDGGGDNDGSEYRNNRKYLVPSDDLPLSIEMTKAGTTYTIDWNDSLGNNAVIDGYYFVYRSDTPFFNQDDLIVVTPLPNGQVSFEDIQGEPPPCTNCFYKVWNCELSEQKL